MLNRAKIISLTANEDLARKIASNLGIEVLPSRIMHFADGEILFEGDKSFRGDDVYIIQSTCAPVTERLMEVLICIDACKRASARSITCVMPYYGYARQDRKAKPRQPITAKLVADLLTTAGCNRIVCCDLHASQIGGYFNIPCDDMSAVPVFYHYFKNMKLENLCCVSPDHGGVTRTLRLAEKLNAPLAIIDKRRPRPNVAQVFAIVGDVKDRDCIIVDDIVDTAGTLCLAAAKLKELGAKRVFAAISHGVLSGPAIERLNESVIEKLIITDSIPLSEEKKAATNKIEVLSLSDMLTDAIEAIQEGESLGEVFQKHCQ